jgi:hypothetical protein
VSGVSTFAVVAGNGCPPKLTCEGKFGADVVNTELFDGGVKGVAVADLRPQCGQNL